MQEQIFDSLRLARAFCEKRRAEGFECDIYAERRRRRRVRTYNLPVSYLRKFPNKRRRVRVSYVLTRQEVQIVTVKIFRVRYFKPGLFESLPVYSDRIRHRYEIQTKNISYPRRYLRLNHTPSSFWTWTREYPPYQNMGSFVKVEVWAVVSRDDNSGRVPENFIYSWSRSRGLEGGVDWETIQQIRGELEADTERMIENKSDYMELHAWIGWTAYPEADWYYKTWKSKRADSKYSRRRKPPRGAKGYY